MCEQVSWREVLGIKQGNGEDMGQAVSGPNEGKENWRGGRRCQSGCTSSRIWEGHVGVVEEKQDFRVGCLTVCGEGHEILM